MIIAIIPLALFKVLRAAKELDRSQTLIPTPLNNPTLTRPAKEDTIQRDAEHTERGEVYRPRNRLSKISKMQANELTLGL
jgi:hypothetical protein